jgi:DNA primase
LNEVEEIKSRLDIAEIVGQYVQLQKAGRTLKAPCPFHAEKTPSFIVSPERQSWHCFGACSTGGDVISFVMKREGIEFPEALRILAEKAGVQLKDRHSSPEQEKTRQRLYAANEAAADWFQQLLAGKAGRDARNYLERRGLNSETIEAFQLGFALDEWHAAQEHLTKVGFSERELLSAGLLVEGERGAHDRFRGRLTFPIWDVKGRVIGFGARAMDDSQPKYLNTSQTALFDKGGTLYALNIAQEAIRAETRAVVVEGYMDVIAAHQHGFRNVIAQMGTALTDRQVRILKRYTADVVLALDSDQAGTQAMIRGHDVVIEAGRDAEQPVPVVNWRGLVTYQEAASIELRVAVLPEGQDPDDVIRADAESWPALIAGATPVLDYRLDAAAAAVDLDNPRGRSELVRAFLPLLGAVTDPVVRAHYLQRLSRLSQTGEEQLAAMLTRPQRAAKSPSATQPQQLAAKGDAREEFTLSLLLQHESLREDGLNVPETLFWDAQARQILVLWKQHAEVNALKSALPPELEAYFERLILRRLPISDAEQAAEAFSDCLQRLRKERLRAEKQATDFQIADLQEEVGVFGVLDAPAQQVIERDTEIGKEIHRHERSDDGAETVETSVNGN